MPGALQGGLDRDAAEVGRGEVLQGAEQPAHRRAGAADDDRAGHGASSAGPPTPATALSNSAARYQGPARRRASGKDRTTGAPSHRGVRPVTRPGECAIPTCRLRARGKMPGVTTDAEPQSGVAGLPAELFTTIDHVGIAVPDLDEAIAFYARPSACDRRTRRSTRSRASARRCWPSATAARIQLLAPLTPESTIAKFIGRSGPGLQQVAFRVDRCRGGERDPAPAWIAAALRRSSAGASTAGSTSSTRRMPAASSWSLSQPAGEPGH